MELEKKVLLSSLFDIYGKLLTEKQQTIFKSYMLDDYSLKEISLEFEVSRSAVFDMIVTIEKNLLHYESVLNVYEKNQQRKALYDRLDSMDPDIMVQLRKLEE